MLNRFSLRRYRYWFYPLLSLFMAVGLSVGMPRASEAISWGDLILRGIQVVQLSNMSDSQEVAIGQQINDELVGSQVKLYRDSDINRYINEIGQRLAANSDRPNLPYKFQVVQDSSINAFATMGGFVYVHTGLLKAADNEAEVAGVIGHEIGHIAGRHSVKQMRQTALARGLLTAAGLDRSTAVNIGVELAIRRPKSRGNEFEADQKGLITLGRAGYAQSAMVTFMEKLLSERSIPTFLSDHPATSDRIVALKRALGPDQGLKGDGLNKANYKAKIQKLL